MRRQTCAHPRHTRAARGQSAIVNSQSAINPQSPRAGTIANPQSPSPFCLSYHPTPDHPYPFSKSLKSVLHKRDTLETLDARRSPRSRPNAAWRRYDARALPENVVSGAGRKLDFADFRPWCEVRFDPASGPGGQNVNKVATRATIVFDFQRCSLLSDVQRGRIARRCAKRLTHDGRLRVVAQQQRTQAGNRELAQARLVELVTQALHVPKRRRRTRPTAASRRRRLESKRRRGEIKRRRAAGGLAE
jgi:ribosome-associated protein